VLANRSSSRETATEQDEDIFGPHFRRSGGTRGAGRVEKSWAQWLKVCGMERAADARTFACTGHSLPCASHSCARRRTWPKRKELDCAQTSDNWRPASSSCLWPKLRFLNCSNCSNCPNWPTLSSDDPQRRPLLGPPQAEATKGSPKRQFAPHLNSRAGRAVGSPREAITCTRPAPNLSRRRPLPIDEKTARNWGAIYLARWGEINSLIMWPIWGETARDCQWWSSDEERELCLPQTVWRPPRRSGRPSARARLSGREDKMARWRDHKTARS